MDDRAETNVSSQTSPRSSRGRGSVRILVAILAVVTVVYVVTTRADYSLTPGPSFVGSVAFSSDGKLLAWTSERGSEGSIVVWDRESRTRRYLIGPRDGGSLAGDKATYDRLAFSPDGRCLAAAAISKTGNDPRVVLWDVATGQLKSTLRGPEALVLGLAFNRDGTSIAAASSRVCVYRRWDVATASETRMLDMGRITHGMSALAFSPEGRFLATGTGDGAIQLWDTTTDELPVVFRGHNRSISSLAFSSDGASLISASQDKTIRFWTVAAANESRPALTFPDLCRTLTLAPDGKSLLLKFAENSRGTLLDLETGRVTFHIENVYAGVAFSPDGKTIAVAGGGRGGVSLVKLPETASSIQ